MKPVSIFWTGGWDSTFRVLNLLVLKQSVVQPYYLIDRQRGSFATEIYTISQLKNILVKRFPECESRLLPTMIHEVNDIKVNATITEQFERLKAIGHLGSQYDWLARFAEEMGVFDLELAIHRDDKAHAFLEHFVTRESDSTGAYYRLRSDATNPDLQIFRYFRFPLFDMTKLEMQRLSATYGFGDIMERTWFCHYPLRSGAPCGTCNPCLYTREEGLVRRIGLVGRMRFHLKALKRLAVTSGEDLKSSILKRST